MTAGSKPAFLNLKKNNKNQRPHDLIFVNLFTYESYEAKFKVVTQGD